MPRRSEMPAQTPATTPCSGSRRRGVDLAGVALTRIASRAEAGGSVAARAGSRRPLTSSTVPKTAATVAPSQPSVRSIAPDWSSRSNAPRATSPTPAASETSSRRSADCLHDPRSPCSSNLPNGGPSCSSYSVSTRRVPRSTSPSSSNAGPAGGAVAETSSRSTPSVLPLPSSISPAPTWRSGETQTLSGMITAASPTPRSTSSGTSLDSRLQSRSRRSTTSRPTPSSYRSASSALEGGW